MDTTIYTTDIIIGGILLLALVCQLYYYVRYINGSLRINRRYKKGKQPISEAQPGVSVIICARNEENNLRNYLSSILEQDYPTFEVIVINDESSDDTPVVLDRYARLYNNLHITFVPTGARIQSSKKLGLTLGVKAAKYDYLLFTDADCRPETSHWISSIMRHYTPGTEIVLGYGAYFREKGLLNKLIQYDTFFNGLLFLGMAASGKPYMGVGRNLSYTKALFERNKGFSGSLQLRSGDDDLFINKTATSSNTQIAIGEESVTWSEPKHTWREWLQQKRRHLYVSPYYSSASKLRIGTESFSRGLFYVAAIALLIVGTPYFKIGAAAALLVRYIVQLCIINASTSLYKQQKFGLGILFYDIFLPLFNLYILLGHHSRKSRRQHW